mgnify:CR=1 FL=1
MVAFFAGLINFGIFPAVGAQFFINFCGLPDSFLGIPMYPLVMIVLLGIALYFVYTGGQIAVIIADFFQGVFVTIVLFIVTLYLLFTIGWDQVSDSLQDTPIKLAKEEIHTLRNDDSFQSLTLDEQSSKINEINVKFEISSRSFCLGRSTRLLNKIGSSNVHQMSPWNWFESWSHPQEPCRCHSTCFRIAFQMAR